MQPSEVVQQWYHTGDTALLHPALEWRVLDRWPAGGLYCSPEKVLGEFFPKLLSFFEHYQAVPEQYYPSGDSVLVSGAYQGVGKRTGQAFRSPFVHIWTVKDSRIIGFRQVADTAAVREVI